MMTSSEPCCSRTGRVRGLSTARSSILQQACIKMQVCCHEVRFYQIKQNYARKTCIMPFLKTFHIMQILAHNLGKSFGLFLCRYQFHHITKIAHEWI